MSLTPPPQFFNAYAQGFARCAVATPLVRLADPARNVERIAALARRADDAGAAVLLTPELSVSGYAIDDLLHQGALWVDGFLRIMQYQHADFAAQVGQTQRAVVHRRGAALHEVVIPNGTSVRRWRLAHALLPRRIERNRHAQTDNAPSWWTRQIFDHMAVEAVTTQQLRPNQHKPGPHLRIQVQPLRQHMAGLFKVSVPQGSPPHRNARTL